jgi:hypothetical protein
MKGRFAAWSLTWALLAVIGLTACGGGGARMQTEQSTYNTTLGQELKDLKDAYEKGIINQTQYEEAKQKLLEQRTK